MRTSQTLWTLILAIGLLALGARTAMADGIDPSYSSSHSATNVASDVDSTTTASWDLSTSTSGGGNSAATDTLVTLTSIAFSGEWGTAGPLNSFGESHGRVDFTADGDLNYTITGAYEADGGAGRAYYTVYLYDITAGSYVFHNHQQSQPDLDDFNVGETAGSHNNVLTGSTTGTLIDDHDYRFLMYALVANQPAAGNSLSGSAWATLSVTPVPEPSSIALLALGLTGFALRRRRRTPTARGH